MHVRACVCKLMFRAFLHEWGVRFFCENLVYGEWEVVRKCGSCWLVVVRNTGF